MSTAERLVYEQFGRSFIDLVVTPELIAGMLNAHLGAEIAIEEEVAAATVTGTATPSPCRATRVPATGTPAINEILVTVPVHISLHVLILDILEEDYDVAATVELRFRVETWSPLTVILQADPVTSDAVTLHISTSSWFKLAERLGGLEHQLKSALCADFSERIEQSQKDRTVDVLERVRTALRPPQ